MALIECYECGKEISSMATSCPHCGAPALEYEKGVDGTEYWVDRNGRVRYIKYKR